MRTPQRNRRHRGGGVRNRAEAVLPQGEKGFSRCSKLLYSCTPILSTVPPSHSRSDPR
ncbi:protein of unknown function (plasmid) [Azospirillum baldaniorum]|uniref:Uncharacterized protein n=1 Tax=Azospirillum baldaniorum TaxID=1064539 RepID=A0A9P1NRR8_9PROT|nr:protein of unknown function [Azospirillum baldaniorum]